MKKQIPFIKPFPPSLKSISPDLEKIYKNGQFSNMGPFEQKFEHQMEKYLRGRKKANVVAVSNATLGLMLAVKAFKLKKPTVLVPSFTFAATVEAIIWAGYQPIFGDIDYHTWSLNLTPKTEKMLKAGKIGMVLFVNPFGMPGNIAPWEKITQKFNIPLLIDSAAGIGSKYPDDTKIGLKGDAEIFSLHITKTFGVGEGGLIVTRDAKLATKFQKMKNFGFDKNHVVQMLGTNAKLPEFASVIGLHVLKNYRQTLIQKRSLTRWYQQYLNPEVKTQKYVSHSVVQFYLALFPNNNLRAKKEKELTNFGVQTRRYYFPPMHQHPIFKNVPVIEKLKVTENISERILALPMHLGLKKKDIKYIAEIINR